MLKITDAQRTRVVPVPSRVVESVGVWKDMVEMASCDKNDEPVVLDESPDTFNLLVDWFSATNFTITKENFMDALELSDKYEIEGLKLAVADKLASGFQRSGHALLSGHFIPPFQIYILAVLFHIPSLEIPAYRNDAVYRLDDYLKDPESYKFFLRLTEIYPTKSLNLIKDALAHQQKTLESTETLHLAEISKLRWQLQIYRESISARIAELQEIVLLLNNNFDLRLLRDTIWRLTENVLSKMYWTASHYVE